jgi:cytochrome c oxidase cbb3-type subunit III
MISMKKVFSIITLLFISGGVLAQEAPAKTFMSDPFSDPLFPLYAVFTFMFVVALMVVLVALYILKVLNLFVRKAAEERAAKLGIVYVPEPSAWSKFWNWINDMKPVEKEAEILLDHNYDGIKELDNHLPPWWKWLFYGTIVWGAVYLVVYHWSDSLPLQDEEYQNAVAEAEAQRAKFLATQPVVVIDENALAYEANEDIIKKGKQVYAINCASCHNAQGQGGIGPNLTDEYWLHGGSIKSIYATIKNGVQEKGMIPWAPVLSPEQMRDVSFYIMSLKGTNPPDPKAPQGEIYVEEAASIKADSVVNAQL